MTDRADASPEVAPDVLARLGLVCLGLPEVQEERAWVGTRWSVRKRTFAHVLIIDAGWPPAYARAAGSNGPLTVLTFRAPAAKLPAPRFVRPPFFRPVWFPNIVGVAIDDRTDWDDLADLLVDSYCVLAPKKLVDLVDRPPD